MFLLNEMWNRYINSASFLEQCWWQTKNVFQTKISYQSDIRQSESKPIFKWSNNYSWTFNGNLAGKSQIKEAVKSEGGKIDGVLRFSIIWNEDGKDILDFDLLPIRDY